MNLDTCWISPLEFSLGRLKEAARGEGGVVDGAVHLSYSALPLVVCGGGGSEKVVEPQQSLQRLQGLPGVIRQLIGDGRRGHQKGYSSSVGVDTTVLAVWVTVPPKVSAGV